MSIFKVSKPGVDAFAATPEQSQIHDEYPPMRIEENKWGLITYTFNTDPGAYSYLDVVAINHGYSYTPAGLVYIQDPQLSNRYGIITTPYNVDEYGYQYFQAFVNASQLIVRYNNEGDDPGAHTNMNGRTYRFKYYIFAEQGA